MDALLRQRVRSRGGELVRLYHPRQEPWDEHFAVHGARIIGLAATGRATVMVLAMNAPDRLQLRTELLTGGPKPRY